MPGALEALEKVLRRADSGQLAAGEALSAPLGFRRQETTRSSKYARSFWL